MKIGKKKEKKKKSKHAKKNQLGHYLWIDSIEGNDIARTAR